MRKFPKPSSADLGNKRYGDYGERLTARWYESHGFTVLERQWRGPAGELDLICQRGTLVVFCEVKTRRSNDFGSPLEAVGYVKQARIRRTAALYLENRTDWVAEYRFDVASVVGSKVEVFECAF